MPVRDANPLAAAVGLLTRVPVGRHAAPTPDQLLRGAPLFPLVGAVLGAAVGGAAVGLGAVLPPLLAGAIAVALELALTGALHVDGLADSADGLGGRDCDHSLEIMRDHSLGAYGASALALDLLVKAVALGALAQQGDVAAVLAVVAVFALSRAAPLPLAAALPYARAGTGTGRLLAEWTGVRRAAIGVALAIAIAVAAVGPAAAALTACLAAVTVATGMLASRRLGGVTGDVMGAATELTATVALTVAVALTV
jgi:adenosylcobinamide-GDP ribazoletransferase